MSLYESVKARYDACIAQATELAQKGVNEARNLSVEEKNTFDGLMTEAEGLAERMKSIAEGEQRARDIDESFRGSEQSREQRAQAPASDLGKWARESRTGDTFDLSPMLGAERRAAAAVRAGESRAMGVGAGNGLGNDGVYGLLWEYAVAGSQLLQAGVDVINTSDGNTLPLPAVTAHATGASAAANAPITASDAALTIVNLSVTKYGYLTLVPSELIQDATFDLDGYLARAAGREMGKIVTTVASTAAIAGFTVSGATAPTASVASPTGGVFSDALIDLFHSVLPEYRTSAAFVMNDVWAAVVRKTKDGSGQYVWERSLVPGNPGMIDGRGVYNDPNFPTAKTNGTKPVYFGDWSALKVRIAGGIRYERSNEYAFGNDQIAFRAAVRTGAAVVDPNAVKFLQVTAS
jgi:HK97 family phage major capsid protein